MEEGRLKDFEKKFYFAIAMVSARRHILHHNRSRTNRTNKRDPADATQESTTNHKTVAQFERLDPT
jgi:hypothetical protein